MGIFGKLGDVFNKIDRKISNDPASVGARFEEEDQPFFWRDGKLDYPLRSLND
jgi:hypothetical protein